MIRYFCDLCGKELEKPSLRCTLSISGKCERYNVILCEKCFSELIGREQYEQYAEKETERERRKQERKQQRIKEQENESEISCS